MKKDRRFDKDARTVVRLIKKHLRSAEIIWAYGCDPKPPKELLQMPADAILLPAEKATAPAALNDNEQKDDIDE